MTQSLVLRDSVKDYLLGQIQKGELPIGKTINLAKLSREIGVSVTPIREALSQLEHARVIKAVPKRGFLVTRLSKEEARDLYEMTAQLEMMALEASSFSKMDLNTLRTHHKKMEIAGNSKDAISHRFEFHGLLVQNCKNKVLLQILEDLKMRLLFYERGLGEDSSFHSLLNNQNEAIVQALEEDNLPAAALILKMSWMAVLEYVESRLDRK
ncbi:GntR family transcriptional regulator [Flagellimonas nanhaiensis]|uniref:GntR family transcriptional regulator n=1 Tax=Flagellimonas nanhaiensis TaxID=2292706 RepID=A0A371JUT9_9FLAO|nr:GntR family transcriptional regulator [Allomuricauda nanhaiensis]RDY61583.1 GntR family transcriptional regulator [Allomuricauda nanhaiensis]